MNMIVTALNNINCTIYKGEMVAIMGTSGSGKSTLLNMISAIDEPTEGALFLFGKKRMMCIRNQMLRILGKKTLDLFSNHSIC